MIRPKKPGEVLAKRDKLVEPTEVCWSTCLNDLNITLVLEIRQQCGSEVSNARVTCTFIV